MIEKPDIAALVGSRICHDLISPIGAIGNGVELMLMDGLTKGPEIALITASVTAANARIRFFRVAFGSCGRDHHIGRNEVQTILSDLSHGNRVAVEWNSQNDLPRRDVKLVFLILLCLETALGHGGRISVERSDTRWTIVGRGEKLRVDQSLWDNLAAATPSAEVTPATVQFAMLPEEAQRQHRRLTIALAANDISFSF